MNNHPRQPEMDREVPNELADVASLRMYINRCIRELTEKGTPELVFSPSQPLDTFDEFSQKAVPSYYEFVRRIRKMTKLKRIDQGRYPQKGGLSMTVNGKPIDVSVEIGNDFIDPYVKLRLVTPSVVPAGPSGGLLPSASPTQVNAEYSLPYHLDWTPFLNRRAIKSHWIRLGPLFKSNPHAIAIRHDMPFVIPFWVGMILANICFGLNWYFAGTEAVKIISTFLFTAFILLIIGFFITISMLIRAFRVPVIYFDNQGERIWGYRNKPMSTNPYQGIRFAEVAALQVCKIPDPKKRLVDIYEMNLVLWTPPGHRVHLIRLKECPAAEFHHHARGLAEFLDVPLLTVSHEYAAT